MRLSNKKSNEFYYFSDEAINIIQADNFNEIVKMFESLNKAGTTSILENEDIDYKYHKSEIEVLNLKNTPTKMDTENKIINNYLQEVLKDNELLFPSLLKLREYRNEMQQDIGMELLNNKLQEDLTESIIVEIKNFTITNYIKNMVINFEESKLDAQKWYINIFLEYYKDKLCIIIIDQEITENEYNFLVTKSNKYKLKLIINNENFHFMNTESVHYAVKNEKLSYVEVNIIDEISYAIKKTTGNNIEYQAKKIKKIHNEINKLNKNIYFYQENNNLHSTKHYQKPLK